MASRLPPFPRFIFTVFEPISLLAGSIPALLKPDWFIAEQLPSSSPLASGPNARLVAQQLGNGFGMAFLIAAAVLYTSNELKVIRNYLIALWIADIGHVGLTLYALREQGITMGSWNPMTYGNVVVTAFLFLVRSAYFIGAFGPDFPVTTVKKSQ